MEILSERCAGRDVQKKHGKVCVATPGEGGKRKKETRTSLTMTHEVVEMREWLTEQGCTHRAMEAPGVAQRVVSEQRGGRSACIAAHPCPSGTGRCDPVTAPHQNIERAGEDTPAPVHLVAQPVGSTRGGLEMY